MKSFDWKQIGGDMDPGKHGGTIARSDGSSFELIEIQPVRACVGDREALEVGYPFWSKEAYFDRADLLKHHDLDAALRCSGIDPDDIPTDFYGIAVAEALLRYGYGDEGRSGWARDIIPSPMRVKWWGSKGRAGWRYLADEDREFRALLREGV